MWQEKPFSIAHAWIDLLLLANSQQGKIQFENSTIILEPGQHLTSTLKLAERWGWTRKKVRIQLKKWQDKGQLSDTKRANNGTILSIANYETYNDLGPTKGQQKGQQTDINNIIYNNIYKNIPEEDKLKRPMSDWQCDVSCINRRLQKLDKLQKGDAKLAAMLIKQHGMLLTLASLEQIIDNEVIFKDEKHAKSYVIATLKKKSIGNTPLKTGEKFYNPPQNDVDYKSMLPTMSELLAGRDN